VQSMPQLDIVIPVYNEAHVLACRGGRLPAQGDQMVAPTMTEG